jgi:hypothetical protein
MADHPVRMLIRGLIRNSGPMTAAQVMRALNDRHMGITPFTLDALLITEQDAGILEVTGYGPGQAGRRDQAVWSLARHAVLCWDKAPKAEPHEEWAAYQSDDCPPGNYAPNMDAGWRAKWKASMHGQRGRELRVEVRKSVGIVHAGSVQVKIVVHEDTSVVMSMNGTAEFTETDFRELYAAVDEARQVMHDYRVAHPREETVAL